MPTITSITPCLWFDDKAEEAARFYTTVFPNSSVGKISHYPENMPRRKGMVMTVTFTLNGQEFLALNGGPEFKFTEAVSFMVNCRDQKEIDYFWETLSAGGEEVQCGWLKDKFGLSWQIVPAQLQDLITRDGEKARRVMEAVLKMKKLDLKVLEEA